MTLLDRFRTQPRQKHADPAVRLAFVQDIPLDERALLAEMARDDEDPRVRKAAVAKLMDPVALAAIAAADSDQGVRDAALWMLRDIALDAFEGIPEADSLAAVDVLHDPKTLAGIAKAALREEVALRALGRISDARAHGSIARHAQVEPVRLAALAALADRAEVLNVALNSEFKDTATTAVERLADRGELEQVEARAKNKSAVKRARALLREMDERAAAAAEEARIAALEAARLAQEARDREQAALEAAARAEAEAAAAEAAVAAEAVVVAAEDTQQQTTHLEAAPAVEALPAVDEAEAARQREEAEANERRRQEEEAERARIRAIEQAEAQERDARIRRDGLARLQQLALRVEALPAKTDLTLKAGERALRDIRTALADVPPLPSRQDYHQIVERLTAAQTALTPKVQELREAVDWQRWANVGVQEQLCQKMEALASVDDAEAIAGQVKELQSQWRAASDVPRDQGDALWRRFKTAHDLAWGRCEAYFADQAAVRAENLAKKLALCEQAEALADSTDWIRTAEAIKGLQSQWKTIGPVSRGQEKSSWERFRTACDRFFTRRQADLVERKSIWTANLARKEALCEKVEALAESTDWDAASAEIKRLQAEWKTVGSVKRSRSEAIWQRFRAACDHFFARYAQRHDMARAERVAAREAICAEVEALLPAEGAEPGDAPADLLAAMRSVRSRWQQELAARGVDREKALALDERFRVAFMRVVAAWPSAFAGSELDFDANRKRMETLVRKVEDLARSLSGRGSDAAEGALSPTTRLAAMLKEALAANTIGGKVADDSRLRAATEEVRQAQAAWSRIGPVVEDARRGLADRFQRASRRIGELVDAGEKAAGTAVGQAGGRAGRPGGAGR